LKSRRKSDRLVAYADSLDAEVYHLHYLVRSVTPGTFDRSGNIQASLLIRSQYVTENKIPQDLDIFGKN
jgi:hypothetical protein